MKFDATKIIAITGTVLTLAATLVGKVADDKKLEKAVAEEVAKALNTLNK